MENRTRKTRRRKKTLLSEKISITIPNPDQPFYAMGYVSNFGIGAALLQSYNGKEDKPYLSKFKTSHSSRT